ncbi:uncharacterized protein [Ptychodera flava]|uniref:uncharacterized protein n=1 Tax=Ptychodera flava TaxID=63121 RepID=UPI00396A4FC8
MSSAGDIDKEISFKVADRPVKRPRSFKDVRSLSYSNLLSHCRAANIITKGISRHALEVLLCHKLHLSTTGGNDVVFGPKLEDHCLDATETKEFERFTPTYVQSLQGWTKNISSIPEIDVGTVKKYLLASPSQDPDFTKASLKRYKLSRSYEHISAKNIHSVMYNSLTESKTFCLVKAQCNPSQSGDSARVKWLHVVLDKMTGEPYGAFCVCAVGKGQACSHVGALLFLLCEIVASGAENLPDDESVTDVLCPWSLPKGAKVHPVKAEDVIVRSTDKQGPTVDNYTSQVAPELSPDDNYQRILQLLSDVRNANSNSCMPAILT